MAAAEPTTTGEVLRLKRVLTVWDLIFYGLVAVTPSAPATVFGLAQVKRRNKRTTSLSVPPSLVPQW